MEMARAEKREAIVFEFLSSVFIVQIFFAVLKRYCLSTAGDKHKTSEDKKGDAFYFCRPVEHKVASVAIMKQIKL
jgi:hypothetical protein